MAVWNGCLEGRTALAGLCVVYLKAEAEADPAERSFCVPEIRDAKLLFPAIPLRGLPMLICEAWSLMNKPAINNLSSVHI